MSAHMTHHSPGTWATDMPHACVSRSRRVGSVKEAVFGPQVAALSPTGALTMPAMEAAGVSAPVEIEPEGAARVRHGKKSA